MAQLQRSIITRIPASWRRAFLLLWFVLCGTPLGAAPPNIILILADDMGYSDPGCYGGEIPTPALDRLASEGVRLSQVYNGGMCVISRAMLLTGKWWPRAVPQFTKTPLVSELLHAANYRTALIGKWHEAGHPMDRGFDHFFGFLAGFADHFNGAPSYQHDRQPFKEFGPTYYSTDAFTDRAIDFITVPAAQKPFFLYLSYQAPHNPLQAPPDEIAKFRGKYRSGWEAVRTARFKHQQALGLIPATASLPAYPQNLPNWSSLSPEQQDLEDRRMAVYAAMISRMDQGIARVIDALEKSGQARNTLILFMSDNGADPFSVVDDAMLQKKLLPGDRNSNWQLGNGWAQTCNTPWRLNKISQHGGGVTTGAIAWWADRFGAHGRIEPSPVHFVDLLPTLMEAAGKPVDQKLYAGASFLPLLQGNPIQAHAPMYFQYMDNRAIRTKEWTLVEVDGAGWELFNRSTDPLETLNLATQQPKTVSELDRLWGEWWKTQSGKSSYEPETTKGSQHYKPQGDRGSGEKYTPRSMPKS